MTAPVRPITAAAWTVPAKLRSALMALAVDAEKRAAPQFALSQIKIAFDLALDGIEARRLAGGGIDAYLAENVRLTDSAVAGLLHLARAAVDADAPSMVAPIACVAIGNYAARLPADLRHGGLLLLLPPDAAARARGERIAKSIIAGLGRLDVGLEATLRTVPALVNLLESFPTLLSLFERRRFIRGRYDLFTDLDRAVGNSEPDPKVLA